MNEFRLPPLDVPVDLAPEDMPDLLRYWYLGTRARRHMMMRRFLEVDRELDLSNGGPVLDVGSAWGYNVMALSKLGVQAVAVDLVVDQFAAGARIATQNGLVLLASGADAASLPFGDQVFRNLTMVETFEHVFHEDRPRVLAECHRVLQPGGRLVLSTPNDASFVERAKRLIASRAWLRSRLPAMCYPAGEVTRSAYHPYQYHLPSSPDRITRWLGETGFRVVREKTFLFVLKNTPDALFPVARTAERLMECLAGLRGLAATYCVVAEKPAR